MNVALVLNIIESYEDNIINERLIKYLILFSVLKINNVYLSCWSVCVASEDLFSDYEVSWRCFFVFQPFETTFFHQKNHRQVNSPLVNLI